MFKFYNKFFFKGEFTIFEEILNLINFNNSESHIHEKFFVIRAKNIEHLNFYSDASIRLEIFQKSRKFFFFFLSF